MLLSNLRNRLVPRRLFTNETLARAFKKNAKTDAKIPGQFSWISLLCSNYFVWDCLNSVYQKSFFLSFCVAPFDMLGLGQKLTLGSFLLFH